MGGVGYWKIQNNCWRDCGFWKWTNIHLYMFVHFCRRQWETRATWGRLAIYEQLLEAPIVCVAIYKERFHEILNWACGLGATWPGPLCLGDLKPRVYYWADWTPGLAAGGSALCIHVSQSSTFILICQSRTAWGHLCYLHLQACCAFYVDVCGLLCAHVCGL